MNEQETIEKIETLDLTNVDILVLKSNRSTLNATFNRFIRNVTNTLDKTGKGHGIVVLGVDKDFSIETIDEKKMKRFGWYKKKGKQET